MKLKRPYRAAQQGFTLLEILMSVGLGSIILASGAQFALDRVNDVKDQSTAQYQKAVTVAAERFLRDNLAAIATPLVQNGAPTAIQLSTIRNAGYLMGGVGAVNPYRQTPCIVVRRLTDKTNGEPRLEALVTTEGGVAIPDRRTPFIAAQGGSYGGFVPATAPTTAQGAYGTWTAPIANFSSVSCTGMPVTANRLAFALFFDGASEGGILGDNVLHRVAVSGRPDLNTMNVALNMGGFDIASAKDIGATGVIAAGTDVTAGRDVLATGDVTAQSDVTAVNGNVYGQVVMATGQDPASFGQTELRRWGLVNASRGIQLSTGGNSQLLLTDGWSNGSGSLLATQGNKMFFYGHTQFSRDATWPCCNPDIGTIGLAEDTLTNGKKASITFHNGGISEGTLELASSGARRIKLYDSQGAGLGLETTGAVTVGKSLTVTEGASFGGQTWQTGRNTVVVDDWAYVADDAAITTFAEKENKIGSAYLNDVYVRSIGKWVSELDKVNEPGAYIDSFSAIEDTGTKLNDTGRTLLITALGGNIDGIYNECELVGKVVGQGTVAKATHNNNDAAKSCAISFAVPPDGEWRVESKPWPRNGDGHFVVTVYRM